MPPETRLEQLEREQEAFDRLLPDLIRAHAGEWVILSGGEPLEFHATFDAAYQSALARFGLEQTFLIAEIQGPKDETASIAWYAGVTFA